MSRATLAADYPRSSLLLDTRSRPLLIQLAAIVLGTVALTASSWVQVPMYPVPITLQALVVTMIGATYGWRLGALTVAAWLAEAACGLPVLAGGASGLAYMVGPTGGYLVSFVLAAAAVGFAAERGWMARSLALGLAVMLVANAAIVLIGAAWLSMLIGFDAAIAKGIMPFLAGGLLKAALGAGLFEALTKMFKRKAR